MSIINKLVSFYKKNKVKTIVLSLITVALLIINAEIFFPIILVSFLTYLWIKSGKKGIDQKKKCSHCKTEIDYLATKCPHCQGKNYVWTATTKVMLGGIILAVVLVASLDTSGVGTTTPVQQLSDVKFISARILAKSYINEIPLTSPSTAKYNPPTTKVDPQNNNLFEVSSYIDSQNGFGAMVRTYWSMKLEFTGTESQESIETDANWKIKEFIFDGEKVK